MLTTPYKVLIACSSLLLLAALGYRVTDLLGGGAATQAAAVAGTGGEEARPRAPIADLQPPPRRPLPPVDAADAAAPSADSGLALGTMAPLTAAVEAGSAVGTGAEAGAGAGAGGDAGGTDGSVPTLVIGRTPGQPRPERPERGDDGGEVVPGGALLYVVQPGDTFQGIAQRTLGDANRWSRVAELNPGVDPLRMQVGDRLNLPPMAEVPADAQPRDPAPAPTPAAAVPGAGATHKVQPGESLTVIALRYYGDSNRWKAIYDANQSVMKSPDDLGIGVELRIPPRDASDR